MKERAAKSAGQPPPAIEEMLSCGIVLRECGEVKSGRCTNSRLIGRPRTLNHDGHVQRASDLQEAFTWGNNTLHSEKVNIYFRNSRRIRFVRLIDSG
jgi:hypothetical protein